MWHFLLHPLFLLALFFSHEEKEGEYDDG